MLDIRDLRALDGPNLYDLAPAVLLRYVGEPADGLAFAERLARAAAEQSLPLDPPLAHDRSALGERALTWRTPLPDIVALLAAALLGLPDALPLDEIAAARAREEPPPDIAAALAEARRRDLPVLRLEDGWQIGHGAMSWVAAGDEPPWERIGRIPIVAVTGTNGKTTTTRLIDHTLRTAGWRTGRTDTDGIWLGGELRDAGDWTGFGGAVEVLSRPSVAIAVLETARGGLLRRGLAFDRCDVAVVTNVTEDHLPDRGVATVAEMARAKATVARVVAPSGRAVLNADDPVSLEVVAPLVAAPVIWFSERGEPPALRAALAGGGTGLFVRDEELWIAQGADERLLMRVNDLPIALGGLARHNIANALAAAAALHALGLSDGQIVLGLASFQANERDNPGRFNQFQRDGVMVVMDYAHNSDGLRVLLHGARPLCGPDGRLFVIYSGTGDRTDAQIAEQAGIIATLADRFVIKRDSVFLRGRPEGEIEPILREAALAAGMQRDAMVELDGDEETLDYAFGQARPGDVIVFTVHKNRATQIERLKRWERGE